MHQELFSVASRGRGTYEITREVAAVVDRAGLRVGLCQVFCRHTSASLIICENADPSVRVDLETYFGRLVPDGDPMYRHDQEGSDDMPAHLRSILTQSGLTLPVVDGRLGLGTWQGLFLWEHRYEGTSRSLVVTVWGR